MLTKALFEIDSRLALRKDYGNDIPEYFEALEIAAKAIQMQIMIGQMIQDINDEYDETNTYSESLVLEMLDSVHISAE